MLSNSTLGKEEVSLEFKKIQDFICNTLEEIDGKSKFIEDQWQRPEGGGGRTRIIQEGRVFEKGGVAFSEVYGKVNSQMAERTHIPEGEFYATGVSLVIHPLSPLVPISHANIRYFECTDTTDNKIRWFGGGIDLTPIYVDIQEAAYFHKALKKMCDTHHKNYYVKFKEWADDYFYIKHREETRGVGGIFFDRLHPEASYAEGQDITQIFEFVKEVGYTYAPLYSHIVKQKASLSFTEKQREWQSVRRSRYVEFNLIYDIGTKFGLESGGRVESIFMSMPPVAAWSYNQLIDPISKEGITLNLLKKNINWINY